MDRGRSIKDGTRFFGFDDDENPRPSISQCAANHIFPVGISEISRIHAGVSGYSLHGLHTCIHFANSLRQKIFKKNLEAFRFVDEQGETFSVSIQRQVGTREKIFWK